VVRPGGVSCADKRLLTAGYEGPMFAPPPRAITRMQKSAVYAKKGSQRWLQIAVEERREMIDTQIRSAMKLPPEVSIQWLCPVRGTGFGEYRDEAFLKLLGIDLPQKQLRAFWPSRGPMWDGLARTSRGEIILIEAKAHIPEMVSPSSKATGDSEKQIAAALEQTRRALAPKSKVSWSGIFYQYTNRLAHLYLLRSLNGVRAHLIYVYFTNARDVFGPTTREEWEGAIKVMVTYLGLGRHRLGRFVHHVFIDVDELLPRALNARLEISAKSASKTIEPA
jgi:hypothetical protein